MARERNNFVCFDLNIFISLFLFSSDTESAEAADGAAKEGKDAEAAAVNNDEEVVINNNTKISVTAR